MGARVGAGASFDHSGISGLPRGLHSHRRTNCGDGVGEWVDGRLLSARCKCGQLFATGERERRRESSQPSQAQPGSTRSLRGEAAADVTALVCRVRLFEFNVGSLSTAQLSMLVLASG